MLKKQSPLTQEWKTFLKREEKLLKRYGKSKELFLEKKLQAVVPDNLSEKLDQAFLKAFQVILKNGTGVIEKTYAKEKLKAEFQTREYAQTVYDTRKNLTAGKRKAAAQTAKNVAGAGAEGAVLGLLGIGLPDIPLFLGVIFRSLYTLALHYGIDYEDGEEQALLLDLLTLSLHRGGDFCGLNAAMNRRLFEAAQKDRQRMEQQRTGKKRMGQRPEGVRSAGADAKRDADGLQEQARCSEAAVQRAAKALSGELLYMKFLQGAPIIGIVGGIYDGIYLKKITDFAAVKLERRYLLSKYCPN